MDREVRAIHVDHGLAEQAEQWSMHCRAQCRQLRVQIDCRRVDLSLREGRSVEAFAREERYRVMREAMDARDMLLTAHTQDDQAETLLLQLLRGAGPAGLAAMPEIKAFGDGWLARPVLGVSRKQIRHYVDEHDLSVVHDPSNQDLRFDRNFLRHEIVPRLEERWPAMASTLSRAASHQGQAKVLLEELGSRDLAGLSNEPHGSVSCSELGATDPERRHNLLRTWIRERGFDVPTNEVIRRLDEEVVTASAERCPMLRWGETQLRRYRDRLYLMRPLGEICRTCRTWNMVEPLALPHGVLASLRCTGQGLRFVASRERVVEVRFRNGQERCRPNGRQHAQTLKRLFQEAAVAPWLRDRIPLIYIDNELAAVAGYWVCAGYSPAPGESGWQLDWRDAALE